MLVLFFRVIMSSVKQPDNRAHLSEESPCIREQLPGETPDGVSRWIVPQKCRLPLRSGCYVMAMVQR